MRFSDKGRLRLRSLFRRGSVERELDAEFRFHIDEQIEENLVSGMAPEEARRAAMRMIGGITQLQEGCRDMRRINLIENLGQDLRFGLRSLRHSTAFSVVAILTDGQKQLMALELCGGESFDACKGVLKRSRRPGCWVPQ